MSVRLSREEVLAARTALDELARMPLNAPAAAVIANMAREISSAASETFDRRNEIVQRYADRNGEGGLVPASDDAMRARGMIRIDPASGEEFQREIVTLLSEVLELDTRSITLKDLTRSSGDPLDVAPAVLLALGPLFRGPESPGPG